MIYLIDDIPAFCPACARPPALNPETKTRFYSGYLQECRCGAQFHHWPQAQILDAVHSSPQGNAN